ncbi:MAG TPA: DegT/DnrJ/EryC1/StrS family aminotransferase [Blastocatellia bacterium]|nr:DegT/DnrJ/EryC1/StrS family aminotransferase [Blastocatellia bacterium]
MAKLAIAGGSPVRTKPFPEWPRFDDRERRAISDVLESRNWGGYPFPNQQAELFARRFADHQSARHALCAANGTVTLEIALKAVGIAPGDEVIVPAYTFEATAAPVLRLGAVPVFVDVLPDTYCIDAAAAAAALTSRTRAIIPVHLAMNMADMDAISELAARHGLKVVEDCAHAHGARWRNQGAGSIGDAGSFSMQTTKLMTAGEGGVVTTNDDEVFELCQSYVNCGRASQSDRFGHRRLGFNYRMTEFQAAILLTQLERLAEQTERRMKQASRLAEGLSGIAGIELLRRDERLTTQAIYQFVFKMDKRAFGGASRDRVVAALEAEGIPADGLFYEPVYRSALFQVDPRDFPALGVRSGEALPWAATRCPVAERAAYEESVWLPHQLLLGSSEDVGQIVEAVGKIQSNLDELLRAEHPLIAIKQTNRAERPRLEAH